MFPVRQTNTNGRGNCMAACWASILEMPIEHVPEYRAIEEAGGSWLNAINTWLSKHHGQIYLELEPCVTKVVQPTGWHLINYGTRERGHSVVGFCGRAVYDPLTGYIREPPDAEPYSVGVLVDLDDDLLSTWAETWDQCLCPACIRGEQ